MVKQRDGTIAVESRLNGSSDETGLEEAASEEPKKGKKRKPSTVLSEVPEVETKKIKKSKTKKDDAVIETAEEEVEKPANVPVEESEVETKKRKKKRKKKEAAVEIADVKGDEPETEESLGKEADAGGEDKGTGKSEENFTVIEPALRAKKLKVRRPLPDWLAKPSVIEQTYTDLMPVKKMKCLDKSLRTELKRNGIKEFFPVQQLVIPALCSSFSDSFYRPRDVCVSAPTGSGKTLAFVLPIVNALRSSESVGAGGRQLRALVILPVHELARQVHDVFRQYSKGADPDLDLGVGLLEGHKSFAAEQRKLVRKGVTGIYHSLVDILVCTPGRLMMHLASTPGFTLQHVRYFVVDEADRVMDSVENNWLHQVDLAMRGPRSSEDKVWDLVTVSNLKKHARIRPGFPQKLLFSATLSQDPEKLEDLGLFMPRLFTSVVVANSDSTLEGDSPTAEVAGTGGNQDTFLGRYTTPPGLVELYAGCDPQIKPLVVHRLVTGLGWKRVLCFTGERESANRLYRLLDKLGGLKVGEFSSNLSRVVRSMMVKRFSRGDLDVLVSSDAMARGMDLPGVEYVVCYDFSPYANTYVHRVGRTARAGKSGTALSLLGEHEVERFWSVMEQTGKKSVVKLFEIDLEELKPMEDKYRAALEGVKTDIQENSARTISAKGRARKMLRRHLASKPVIAKKKKGAPGALSSKKKNKNKLRKIVAGGGNVDSILSNGK